MKSTGDGRNFSGMLGEDCRMVFFAVFLIADRLGVDGRKDSKHLNI